jgi:hypothetical protein
MNKFVVALLVFINMLSSVPAVAGGKKEFAKAAIARLLERDAARDAVAAFTRTGEERFVYRYATLGDARRAEAEGLRPGSHVTTGITLGRPLGAPGAQDRFGLPQVPEVRMKVRLPAGTLVKEGKVLGGQAGYGEIVVEEPLPADSIVEVVPLR